MQVIAFPNRHYLPDEEALALAVTVVDTMTELDDVLAELTA